MPFEELAHGADWALRVRAVSLPELFVEATRGLYWLAGTQAAPGTRFKRTYADSAADAESLLVGFLSELVFAAEQERLVFETFAVKLAGLNLEVSMSGAPLLSLNKSIKAVTFHNLNIRTVEFGYEVEIVFDV